MKQPLPGKYTAARDLIISKELRKANPIMHVHKGNAHHEVALRYRAVKLRLKLGVFAFTKNLGKDIHKTEKNQKRKEKLKNPNKKKK